MTNYRRIYIPGSYVFFTVVTYKRQDFLLSSEARRCLKSAWRFVIRQHPFQLIALVLIPDHLHCIWKLPENDSDFSIRWGRIKKHFSQSFRNALNDSCHISNSMKKRSESGLWQRRFWDHVIRDDRDFKSHLDYIHFNPVKHGLVRSPIDWPWSTFYKYVKMGIYEADWGSDLIDFDKNQKFGE